jgi:hypothetical protein
MWVEALVAALFTPIVFRLLDGSRRVWGLD